MHVSQLTRASFLAARVWLRRALLPDRAQVWPHGEVLERIWVVRLFGVLACLLIDVAIVVGLWGVPGVSTDTLRVFSLTNLTALGVDAVITWFFLRRDHRWNRPLLYACATIEALAATAFVQMTGSVTTYFIGGFLLLIVVYRLVFDYALGSWLSVVLATSYVGVIVLEHHGVLPYASLFTAGARLAPPVEIYRFLAAASISVGVFLGWIMGNLAATVARAHQARIARLEADLARAALQAHAGRLSGTRAGDYQLEELLGRGGMGEVYAARDRHGREVAIKVLHPHLGADGTVRERFRRESAVVEHMPPGTVARVLATGTTDEGADYIVMERLRGEDLGARLRRVGRLPSSEVLAIAERLAAALDAAHALGIVHRDLKPTNIFLVTAPDGRLDLRLLDFGVAHLHDVGLGTTLTATGAIMGSPGYMAPEVIMGGASAASPAADIFACAAVLYLAISGRAAFPARSASGALFEALNVTPPSCRDIDAELHADIDAVMAIGLAKSPGDRHRRASDLAADLRLAIEGRLPERTRERAAELRGGSMDCTLTTLHAS